jgi:peptide/nickel transport system permease protein
LLSLIPVLLAVSFLVFALGKVTPGDPARMMLGERATPREIERLRAQLYLDEPLFVQYGHYVRRLLHGDLGRSYRGQTPVLGEILRRVPASFELGLAAFLFAVLIGVPAGAIAGSRRNQFLDRAIMLVAVCCLSLPVFWMAILIVIVFGVQLQWIPVIGAEGLRALDTSERRGVATDPATHADDLPGSLRVAQSDDESRSDRRRAAGGLSSASGRSAAEEGA